MVRYEDLQRDPIGEVEKILDFLNFPYIHEDVVTKLSQDYTVFKRLHPEQDDDDFRYFTAEQKQYIKDCLLDMIELSEKCGKSHLFQFEDYLKSLE